MSRLLCCVLLGVWVQGHLASTALSMPPPDSPARIAAEGINGSLVICGGGKIPEEAARQFMKLAGGAAARLVVIPTAAAADNAAAQKHLSSWRERKPASVVLLHTRSRQQAETGDFVKPLRKATGVWIGGGIQSRISAAYLGTAVEKELYELLSRGGVIGGTSAGAAIMSRVMIAGGKDKAQMGTGFDLLPGSVIDQHFIARKRRGRRRTRRPPPGVDPDLCSC